MKRFLLIALGIIAVIVVIGVIGSTSEIANSTDEAVSIGDKASKIEILQMDDKWQHDMHTVFVTVKNNSDKLCSSAMVKVIYLDENDRVVGSGGGGALNIPSGGTKVVECLSMGVEGASKYEAEVEMALFE